MANPDSDSHWYMAWLDEDRDPTPEEMAAWKRAKTRARIAQEEKDRRFELSQELDWHYLFAHGWPTWMWSESRRNRLEDIMSLLHEEIA